MRVFIALLLGVLGYFIAHLVFNDVISMLIGIAIGVFVYFGDDYRSSRL